MISIIISSANRELLDNLGVNIKETIGVPYEILAFENDSGQKGICEIYNSGAQQARYEILCFTHEDIRFNTVNWGRHIINTFASDKKIGLIGLAGSSYKSAAPTGWYHASTDVDTNYLHIIQHRKTEHLNVEKQLLNPSGEKNPRVVMVDGVWFCTTKEVMQKVSFDEELLRGFHCYDLDFSFSVGKYYDIVVTYDVLLEHFSEGNYGRAWFENTLKLHKKWKNILPLNLAGFNKKEVYLNEKKLFKEAITQMRVFGYSKRTILTMIIGNYRLFGQVGYKLLFSLVRYTLTAK